ncbi:hypothetical protein [Streptomyces sp. NPDC001315]|uniref:hypothetical protein n=1 Tax=Streptomyces sp. NPDC001315 TaxID=3364562 RepID=UPI0036CDCBAD
MGGLREVAAPFLVPGPAGVAIRARLRVSGSDAAVLAEAGVFLGSLAADAEDDFTALVDLLLQGLGASGVAGLAPPCTAGARP